MNDLRLYENIPADGFPIRVNSKEPAEYHYMAHWHEHIEIQCFFSGKGRLKTESGSFDLDAGSVAVINSGELHECVSGYGSWGCIILPPSFSDCANVRFVTKISDEKIVKMISSIYELIEKKPDGYVHAVRGYACLIISRLIEKHKAAEEEEPERIAKALEFLKCHYRERVTLSDLAGELHMTGGYLSRLFKSCVGLTPMAYVKKLRLEKAAELLASTDMNITETAEKCGFDDPNYFARLFKKSFGKTPREFKNEGR